MEGVCPAGTSPCGAAPSRRSSSRSTALMSSQPIALPSPDRPHSQRWQIRKRTQSGTTAGLFCGAACVIEPPKSVIENRNTGRQRAKGSAMKAEIHPNYHMITVVMTDGTEYQTRSTWGKPGDKLNLDIDSKSHPAWIGGAQQILDRGGRVSRFQKKFSGFLKKE